MALNPLSLRAYANHRRGLGLAGGSLQAVQRAISGGRVRDAVVVVDGVRKISDPELADREWAANTDLSKAPDWLKQLGETGDDLEDDGASPLTLASAREKHFKAKLAELNYQQRAGELVNAEDMQAEIAETFSKVRTRLLAVPSKVKQTHQELALDVLATIDGAIREALEELATSRATEAA